MKYDYGPIHPKIPFFLHGADYNPDQWLDRPDVLKEDIRLMKLASVNVAAVGIFAWTALEPEEGKFDFQWLDDVMDRFADNGIYAILATPSGARPAWMSAKYPEVLRVDENRFRNLHGRRHNHCYTSPVYRKKVETINTMLAERYSKHPALVLWHVSNEYGGNCHCDLCQAEFRRWLRLRYDNDLDRLNRAWWTAFWSHTYTDFEQIESPGPRGEDLLHGLVLDWKRFCSDRHVDFLRHEIKPLKKITPGIPVTTNFMGFFPTINYWDMAKELDVISWDNYPKYHDRPDQVDIAVEVSFAHNLNRSFKGGKPFMLMECTPSATNWWEINKPMRPGMLRTLAMQSVAHGADTIQYFQWRKSRGASEKFHAAVVDHVGHEHTRVFSEVAALGTDLSAMKDVIGSTVHPEVAFMYDWQSQWAMEESKGPRNHGRDSLRDCYAHYRPFWEAGIPADVIDEDADLSPYKLVIAPMLYMLRDGAAERIESFVNKGGTFVCTYMSGIADETDLVTDKGFPGPLRDLMGVWAMETDILYDDETNTVVGVEGNSCGLRGKYMARAYCDVLYPEGAKVMAEFGGDYYAGNPALTCNSRGKGEAWYIASRNDEKFIKDFYGYLVNKLGIEKVLDSVLPEGVSAHMRTNGRDESVFIMNFVNEKKKVALDGKTYTNLLTGMTEEGEILLAPHQTVILTRPARK